MKESLKAIWVVLRAELWRLAISPATYLTLVIMGLLWFFLFFRQAFLIGESSLRLLFEYVPWLGIILVPALTMGSLAKDRSAGMLEWVLVRPVKELELVLGKWLAVVLVLLGLMLLTLPIAVGFSRFGEFDWGVYLSQIGAMTLLLASYAAIGIAVSTWLKEQISALLVTVAVLFGLTIVGFELITSRLPLMFASVAAQASPLTHAVTMSRGVIDVRDVWYLIVVMVLSLSLAVLKLSREKYGKQKKGYRWSQMTVGLLIVVLILSVVYSQRLPGRVDLTADRLFSLADVTSQTIAQAEEPVTLTLYASQTLPSQLQPVLRDVKDMLRDYDQVGGDKITIVIKNPSSDQTVAQEAVERGVQEVQFNQISQESFQVNSGWLGVVVSVADQHEAVPFVQSVGGLEYELTSRIAQLTRAESPKVAITAGHGEKSLLSDLQLLDQLLGRQYELATINLTEAEEGALAESLAGYDAVVVAGPTGPFENIVLAELNSYASAGGSLFVMAEGAEVNPQQLSVAPSQHNVDQVTNVFGVGIRDNLVFDPSSSEVVRLGAGSVQYLAPYPWWVKALGQAESEIVQKDQLVFLPWVSEVGAVSGANTDLIKSLVVTSANADSTPSAQASIDPQNVPSVENPQELTLAVAVEKKLVDDASQSARLVLVGDADFITDGVLQNAPQNASVILDVMAWLTRDTSLAELKLKEGVVRTLIFSSPNQPASIMGVSYVTVVLLPGLVGVSIFLIRRSKQRRIFK